MLKFPFSPVVERDSIPGVLIMCLGRPLGDLYLLIKVPRVNALGEATQYLRVIADGAAHAQVIWRWISGLLDRSSYSQRAFPQAGINPDRPH